MPAFAGSAPARAGKTAAGSCAPLFGANICTSYRMRAGRITEFTLRVPVAMIEDAPAVVHMSWPPKADLNVPFAPVVAKQTGFTYANIYWEVHGHGPAPYMVPHFDFHFYVIPERKVDEITCKDTVKPRAVPAGYALPPDESVPNLGKVVGACIPDMGMHAAPDTDFNRKTPWKGSLLLGYYDAKPIFFEPMLTTALLLQKHSFSLPVPQGIEPAAHVRYPKGFRAVYLPKSKAYDLTFFY
ncbi:MAG: hypothetical protein WAM66_09870 [Acidobacteriaceae bacterium]